MCHALGFKFGAPVRLTPCHCPFDKLKAVSLSNREEERRGNPAPCKPDVLHGAARNRAVDCFGRLNLSRNDKEM